MKAIKTDLLYVHLNMCDLDIVKGVLVVYNISALSTRKVWLVWFPQDLVNKTTIFS